VGTRGRLSQLSPPPASTAILDPSLQRATAPRRPRRPGPDRSHSVPVEERHRASMGRMATSQNAEMNDTRAASDPASSRTSEYSDATGA
jgi:hypothetical protein